MSKKSPPKTLLRSKYRKDLWNNTEAIIDTIGKVLPITSIHLMGSFASKKRRPADVDFVVLLKTGQREQSDWSVDLVIAPDNKHGEKVLEDAKKWMKQKYCARNSQFITLS